MTRSIDSRARKMDQVFQSRRTERPNPLFRSRPTDLSNFVRFYSARNDFDVFIHRKAILQLFHFLDRAGPNEAMGLLAGRPGKDDRGVYTIITGAVRARDGEVDASPGRVRLTANQKQLLRRHLEKAEPIAETVGWWHTHPHGPNAYSAEDHNEQATWPEQYHVGVLVVGPPGTARITMYQGPEARPLIASSTLDALLPTARPIVARLRRSLVQAERTTRLAPKAAYLLFLAWLVLVLTIGGAFHLLNRRIDALSLSLPSPETVLLPDGIVPAVNFGCYPRSGPAPLTISCADFTPGTIQTRHWDFGDGSEGYGLVTTHTYSVAGEYTVSLAVHSPDAGVSKGWRKSYIVVATKPPVGAANDE